MAKYTFLPLIPLRGLTVFPQTTVHFDVGRPKSLAALADAVENTGGYVLLASQKSNATPNPNPNEICEIGVLAKVVQVAAMPDEIKRIVVTAEKKIKLTGYIQEEPFYVSSFATVRDKNAVTPKAEAYFRRAKEIVSAPSPLTDAMPKEMLAAILDEENANVFCYQAAHVFLRKEQQAFLELSSLEERLEKLTDTLINEMKIAEIDRQIMQKVKDGIDDSQKEYYLREQMRAIEEELGEGEEDSAYIKKIDKLPVAKEYKDKLKKDLERGNNMSPSSPDYALTRNYLDFVLELPWGVETEEELDLKHVKEVLDEAHYGLEKVKDRIMEFIAVKSLTSDNREPIMCLVGPPGVGKTSVVKSIADAIGRKYVRMSLGGVHDEAEIRGHRKTYIGAMAGRIVTGIKQAGSMNPVFLLDEIDKLASDYRGDPASALLEVLDPEQNNSFRDNYLEIPFDLSNVIFITTANSAETIPPALYDRMEIVEMSGYTPEEKFQIAKRHLVPKELKINGLPSDKFELSDEVLWDVIRFYTRESGARGLEKAIGEVMRKAAREFVESGKEKQIFVNSENLSSYLGPKKFLETPKADKDEIGTATGLAWTSIGGEILSIEVSLIPGKGELLLTGHLGDVMKESARAGVTYIRANEEKFGLSDEIFKTHDIHIHVPEGAIPKDGPSAGITIATAVLSALTEKGVKSSVAMTGEITLRGKVLPIGGLKEKMLAANRAGIETVVIPKENQKDLTDIPESVRAELKIVPVEHVSEVFEIAINNL